jgi:hypothetical protein
MAELLPYLYPLLTGKIWTAVIFAGLVVVCLVICLWGSKPAERAEIIRALGYLFRSFRRLKRGGESLDDGGSSKPINSP